MNPLHRDILLNLLKADRVYWYEDSSEEPEVVIVEFKNDLDYVLSQEATAICVEKNKWFPSARGNFTIRNMVIDFDGSRVNFDLYLGGGDASDYDIEY